MLSLAFKNISRLPLRKRWPWFKNDTTSTSDGHAFCSGLQTQLRATSSAQNHLNGMCVIFDVRGARVKRKSLDVLCSAAGGQGSLFFRSFSLDSTPRGEEWGVKIACWPLIWVCDHSDHENIMPCLSREQLWPHSLIITWNNGWRHTCRTQCWLSTPN